jgi:hypothetical protein
MPLGEGMKKGLTNTAPFMAAYTRGSGHRALGHDASCVRGLPSWPADNNPMLTSSRRLQSHATVSPGRRDAFWNCDGATGDGPGSSSRSTTVEPRGDHPVACRLLLRMKPWASGSGRTTVCDALVFSPPLLVAPRVVSGRALRRSMLEAQHERVTQTFGGVAATRAL